MINITKFKRLSKENKGNFNSSDIRYMSYASSHTNEAVMIMQKEDDEFVLLLEIGLDGISMQKASLMGSIAYKIVHEGNFNTFRIAPIYFGRYVKDGEKSDSFNALLIDAYDRVSFSNFDTIKRRFNNMSCKNAAVKEYALVIKRANEIVKELIN